MISVQNFVVRSMSVTVNTTCPSFFTLTGVPSRDMWLSSSRAGRWCRHLVPSALPRQPAPGRAVRQGSPGRVYCVPASPGRAFGDRRGGDHVRATADTLRRLISAIVKKGGSADAAADLVADHLVRANLMGHDSHGVGMIPTYVRHLKMGLVVPNTRVKVVKDDGALLMFDGGRGYGRPVAGQAMDAAIA